MLEKVFLTVFNMSITASIAAALVLLIRQTAGRKFPKSFSYAAWSIVLIRLLVPFSLQSDVSIFNIMKYPANTIEKSLDTAKPLSKNVNRWKDDTIDQIDVNNIVIINETEPDVNVNSSAINNSKGFYSSINTNKYTTKVGLFGRITPLFVISFIWLTVAFIILIIFTYSYYKTCKRLKTSVLFDDKGLLEACRKRLKLKRKVSLFISESVDTPVVTGISDVRILVPEFIVQKSGSKDIEYIIMHELIHIKRCDNITKLLALLALCIHWFNPFMWFCFLLYQKDMEMSCDTIVLSAYENDIRCEYANCLLNIAVLQNTTLFGGVPAFGESNIRERVMGIMKYRKTKTWIGIFAAILLVVFGFVLLTNGRKEKIINKMPSVINDETLNNLLKHRSRYIGDASNVSNLIDKLTYGKKKESIELDTDDKPYGITINYTLDDINANDDSILKNVKPALFNNALIIFSLIENVDIVKFNIQPANIIFQYDRAELQQYFEMELWEYSGSKEYFEKFLLDINFEIFVYPEYYSIAISSIPGLQIQIALNAEYYDLDFIVEYKTKNGILRTWDRNTGKITNHGNSLNISFGGPVYWVPDMDEGESENSITITIKNKDGKTVNSKSIHIEKVDNHLYRVKPSYDVIIDEQRKVY